MHFLRVRSFSPSVSETALDKQAVKMVEINRVGDWVFGENGKWCLGTTGHNACTAFIPISTRAAILAHIAPRKVIVGHDHTKFGVPGIYLGTTMVAVGLPLDYPKSFFFCRDLVRRLRSILLMHKCIVSSTALENLGFRYPVLT